MKEGAAKEVGKLAEITRDASASPSALCPAFRVSLAVSHRASYPNFLASLHSLDDLPLKVQPQ